MKKIFIYLLLAIVLSSFASAEVYYQNQFEQSTDCDTTFWIPNGGNAGFPNINTTNFYNGTASCSYSAPGGSNVRYHDMDYDGTIDGMNISIWIRFEDLTHHNEIRIATAAGTNEFDIGLIYTVSNTHFVYYDGSYQTTTIPLTDDVWYNLNFVRDGNNLDVYVDGVLAYTRAATGLDLSFIEVFSQGNGYYDNLIVYTGNLTPGPTPPSTDEYTESTALVQQLGNVSFTSTSLVTIVQSEFNVSVNNTEIYGEYNFNVVGSKDNEIYCELQIDGVQKVNVTRSNTQDQLGSISMMSEHFTLENGTHTQALLCRRTTPASSELTLLNVIGVGHFMRDSSDNVINHASDVFSSTVTSGSTMTNIENFTFTISNATVGENVSKHLVLEWSATYTNNDAADEILGTEIFIYRAFKELECAPYPRTVSAGSTGSVGGDCLLENVTTNATYTMRVYANGTNADYSFNIMAKELGLSDEEIAGGQGALIGSTFSGNTDTELIKIAGGNVHHPLANVFEKQSYSILCNDSTTVSMYITLNDSVDLRTLDMTRDFEAGVIGVVTGHDIFENVPADDYNLSVFANAGSPTATCEIVGGAGIGYLTDVVPTTEEGLYINAFDDYFDTVISDFTATNGITVSTTTGQIFLPTSSILVNFTVSSDKYYNQTFVNWNTSNVLNVNLTPYPWVNITLNNVIDGTPINDFSVAVTGENTYSTTDGELLFRLVNGTYNITVDAENYSLALATIDALSVYQNYTIDVYTTNSINITFKEELTDTIIDFATVDIDFIGTIDSYNYSTSVGWLYADLISPDTYTLSYRADGYVPRTYAFTMANRSNNELTLYLLNNTAATNVTATVFDKGNQETIEGVYIKVLKFDVPTNSYVLQEIGQTNFEGQSVISLILNDAYYKFILEFPLGTVVESTDATLIYKDTIEFQINTGTPVVDNFFDSLDASGEITYVGNTFRFEYTDPTNIATQFCMEVTEVVFNNTIDYEYCSSSPTGTIFSDTIVQQNGSFYKAMGYVYYGTDKYLVATYAKDNSVTEIANNETFFYVVLLLIVFASFGFSVSPTLGLFITPIPLVLGKVIGFVPTEFGWGVVIGIWFAFIVGSILVARK